MADNQAPQWLRSRGSTNPAGAQEAAPAEPPPRPQLSGAGAGAQQDPPNSAEARGSIPRGDAPGGQGTDAPTAHTPVATSSRVSSPSPTPSTGAAEAQPSDSDVTSALSKAGLDVTPLLDFMEEDTDAL